MIVQEIIGLKKRFRTLNDAKRPESLFTVILRDGALTLFSEGIVLVSFFIFYRLLAEYFGPENVGVYSLMRRIAAFLIPLVMIGLVEGLGRYIAMVKNEDERSAYFVSGLSLFLISISAVLLLLNLNTVMTAKWALGSEMYATFVFPFSVLLSGIAFHTFSYACLRGNLKIKLLNLFHCINLGVIPIFLLMMGKQWRFELVLTTIGFLQMGTALAFLWPAFAKAHKIKNKKRHYYMAMNNLFMFGAPRIPAPILGAALISICPMVASHFVSITEVGYLSVAMALLIGIGGLSSPLGTVLLPHISSLLGSGEIDRFGRNLYLLIGALIQCLLFFLGQFIVFVDFILTIWLGRAFLPASAVMIVTFASILAYGFHNIARNILDASSLQPINTINSIIAFTLLTLLLLVILYLVPLDKLAVAIALAFTLAYNALGALSYHAVRRIHPMKLSEDWRHLKWAVILNGIAGLLALTVKSYVAYHLLCWLSFELVLFILYITLLHRLKFEWIQIIHKMVLRNAFLSKA